MMRTARAVVSLWVVVGCGLAAWGESRVAPGGIPADTPGEVMCEILVLHSDEPRERAFAAYRLGEMGPKAKAAVPFLVGMLGDSGNVERGPLGSGAQCGGEAARALVKIGPDAVEPLIEALRDERTAGMAAWALGSFGSRVIARSASTKAFLYCRGTTSISAATWKARDVGFFIASSRY